MRDFRAIFCPCSALRPMQGVAWAFREVQMPHVQLTAAGKGPPGPCKAQHIAPKIDCFQSYTYLFIKLTWPAGRYACPSPVSPRQGYSQAHVFCVFSEQRASPLASVPLGRLHGAKSSAPLVRGNQYRPLVRNFGWSSHSTALVAAAALGLPLFSLKGNFEACTLLLLLLCSAGTSPVGTSGSGVV